MTFEVFDLWEVLVNNFAGSELIFMGIAFIVIAILAARFRMPGIVFTIVIFMFAVLVPLYVPLKITIIVVTITVFAIMFSRSFR